MNGYNNYNNYSNDPQGGGGYSTQQEGWEYVNGSWRQVGGGAQPVRTAQKRRGPGALGVLAMLLACAVFGFGGAWAALNLFGQSSNQTVVYRSPELLSAGNTGETLPAATVAAQAGQSVVSINTETLMAGFGGSQLVQGAGSGVIISQDGYIITNHHVIEGAHNVIVVLPDGTECPAIVVGSRPENDIAVLKVNVEGLVPVVVGNSDNLVVGEDVLAIGNSMGLLGGTVTDGIISALNREVAVNGYDMNLLQMSAAVSPGNSGGGLFNMRGELIGIVNAKNSGQSAEGLGFAIPVNTAIEVAQQLIESGAGTTNTRPGIGVSILEVGSDEQAAQAGLPGAGVYISIVNRAGPAEAAGLQVGDRIVGAAGNTVETSDDLSAVLQGMQVGDTLTLQVEREGELLSFDVVLGQLINAA